MKTKFMCDECSLNCELIADVCCETDVPKSCVNGAICDWKVDMNFKSDNTPTNSQSAPFKCCPACDHEESKPMRECLRCGCLFNVAHLA